MVLGRLRFNRLQLAVHLISLYPLAALVVDGLINNLTINPIQAITQRTGDTAILWLVFSLTCTPLQTLTGWHQPVQVRRALGLYAFFYALLHFLTYTVLDYGLNFRLLFKELGEKPYVMVGAAAFVILLALAITSTRGWMKRMGKRWKSLHQLVYAAGLLVVVHYLWAVKADIRLPLLYGLVLAILFMLRIPTVRRGLAGLRQKLSRPLQS
jgi:sulfoxide reductase heme-binding subunit YedZ